MKKGSLLVPVFIATVCFSVSAMADDTCFCGPFDPVGTSGNLINYEGASADSNAAFSASISPDYSTLTLYFTNSTSNDSIFSNFINEALLPSGTVSYDWSVTFPQTASWLLETDVNTTFPGGDQFGNVAAGTYTGTATLNYTSGNYLSFGNIGFGTGAPSTTPVVLTLTDFDFAATSPEPATALILPGGLLALWVFRRRRRSA